jgi:hypothetical protein
MNFLDEQVYGPLNEIGITRPTRVALAVFLEWAQASGRFAQMVSDPYVNTLIACACGVCSILGAEELGEDIEDISLTYLDEDDGSNYALSLAPIFFHGGIAASIASYGALLADSDSLLIMPLAFALKQLASTHTTAMKLAAQCQARGQFAQAAGAYIGGHALVLGTAGIYIYSRYFKSTEG